MSRQISKEEFIDKYVELCKGMYLRLQAEGKLEEFLSQPLRCDSSEETPTMKPKKFEPLSGIVKPASNFNSD